MLGRTRRCALRTSTPAGLPRWGPRSLHLATFFRLRCRLVVSNIHNSSSGTAKHRPEAVLIDLKFLAEVPVTIPLVALKAALRLRG